MNHESVRGRRGRPSCSKTATIRRMVAVLLPVTGILPLCISPGYKLNRVFIQLFFIMMLSMIFAACSAASQQASSPSKMLVHAITLTGSREPV